MLQSGHRMIQSEVGIEEGLSPAGTWNDQADIKQDTSLTVSAILQRFKDESVKMRGRQQR